MPNEYWKIQKRKARGYQLHFFSYPSLYGFLSDSYYTTITAAKKAAAEVQDGKIVWEKLSANTWLGEPK